MIVISLITKLKALKGIMPLKMYKYADNLPSVYKKIVQCVTTTRFSLAIKTLGRMVLLPVLEIGATVFWDSYRSS